MRIFISIALLIAASLQLVAQESESKNYYLLTINDKKYLVEGGKEFQVQSNFQSPIISIEEANLMFFENSFLEFYYPSNLSLSTRNDFGYNQWLLKDGKFSCSIHSFENEISGDAAAERILALNAFQVELDQMAELTLGSYKLTGKKYFSKDGNMIEIYRIPSPGNVGRFITLIAPEGKQEKKDFIDLLSSTIKISSE